MHPVRVDDVLSLTYQAGLVSGDQRAPSGRTPETAELIFPSFMSLVGRAVSLGALILALVGLPSVEAAKTIMIFAPHPDDESLVAAAPTPAAVNTGDTPKSVIASNGDYNGRAQQGLWRTGES